MVMRPTIFVNQFPVRHLSAQDMTVYVYDYQLTTAETADSFAVVNRNLWKIGAACYGVKLGNSIVTNQPILTTYLANDEWKLLPQEERQLSPKVPSERKALERLNEKQLRAAIRRLTPQSTIDSAGKGFIWWSDDKVEAQGDGWKALKGVVIDVVIDEDGCLYLEIDNHYRFHSPLTLHEWLEKYPDAPVNYVRNLDDKFSWYFLDATDEKADQVSISELGKTLAEYHRDKGVDSSVIQESIVVRVKSTRKGKQSEVPHLSKLLRPSVSMEVLSYLEEQGDSSVSQILSRVRMSVDDRLEQGAKVASWIAKKIYQQSSEEIRPKSMTGTLFEAQPLIAHRNIPVLQARDVLTKGSLRVGETKLGFLSLLPGILGWPPEVHSQLLSTARANGVSLDLEHLWLHDQMPSSEIDRRGFWNRIAQEEQVKTVLLVSKRLGARKTQLRKEALQAGIAIQFMYPNPNKFRSVNITLGLLLKASWQTVGMKMLDHPKAAELVIGFDAGTNKSLFYGTSAFAVLADGQSLGWEIPEAQVGESFSGKAIWEAILNILERFRQLNDRLPRRVMLLRDGFVREHEFDAAIDGLETEGIAVDLLEVHKSGAGRIAIETERGFQDAPMGTGFSVSDKGFRIVTSKATAGGSARPLEVVHLHGDAELPILASQIFSLSELHPASGFMTSRLPMPLHQADRMIKEVQRIGTLGILHGVDRTKIFAA
jgi:hypothetical protein